MATDPGSTFFTARNTGFLNGTKNIRESLSARDRVDYYALRLSGKSSFNSRLNRFAAGADADLALFDSDLQQLAVSKNSGRQAESIDTVLDAGVYYVKVTRKSSTVNYNLRLRANPFVQPDAGNDLATASAITVGSTGSTFSDSVGGTDASDFYKFDTTAFGNLKLNVSGLAADANVQLLNSTGVVLRSSIAGGTAQESIDTSLEAGTYFVRVFPGNSAASTAYNLTAAFDPLKFVGLASNNAIVSFDSTLTNPTSVNVTGLANGESLLGIDFRPATGQLIGLSSTSRLYSIDTATGAATAIGTAALNPALNGTKFGIDFNPTVDRIRVVSDTEQNLRLNPDTGAIAAVDTPLAYAAGDANAAQNPSIVGSAYTGNFAGSTSTTLYSIDSNLDTLVTQGGLNSAPSPNGGQLFTIGALGADFNTDAGFDIFTDRNQVNAAFASSGSTVYRLNLTTGAATALGTISVGSAPVNLVGLAVRP